MLKNIFYGWWIVLACFLIGFLVASIAVFGFTAFIEPLREEFGWSYTQISFAGSMRIFVSGIFGMMMGALIDRFGSRKIILFGTISVGIGLVLLSRIHSLGWYYAAFCVLALGTSGTTTVALSTAVANWFKKRAGLALSLIGSSFGAGGLLVPLIVSLIGIHGWRNTLIVFGLGLWIVGIPLSLFVRDTPEQYGYLLDGQAPEAETSNGTPRSDTEDIGLKDAFKHKTFIFLNFAEAFRITATFAVTIHVMPYLSASGIPRRTGGLVAAAIPLISILGGLGLGWLGDFRTKKFVMATSFIFMSLGILAFCLPNTVFGLLFFLLLFPLGAGGSTALRGSMLREYFGRRSFGKIIGVVMISGSTGGLIGPTLSGWIFDTFGTYRPMWIFVGILCALTAGMIARVKD